MIKELMSYVVKQLVNNPDQVVVTVVKSADKSNVEISVSEQDRGKVIGREGQTIKALRMMVNAITPDERKVVVDVSK